jgi:hypothetical protein
MGYTMELLFSGLGGTLFSKTRGSGPQASTPGTLRQNVAWIPSEISIDG